MGQSPGSARNPIEECLEAFFPQLRTHHHRQAEAFGPNSAVTPWGCPPSAPHIAGNFVPGTGVAH
jgi:hypothetical protein